MSPSLRFIAEEFRQLARPYYLVNMVLCLSFLTCKLIDPICSTLFSHYGQEACELDMRENEILFFLLIVVMIRYQFQSDIKNHDSQMKPSMNV